MTSSKRSLLFQGIGLVFFIFILIFGYNRFERYIHGPQIVSLSLEEYQYIDTLSLTVTGELKNVATLMIQGRNINFNKEGIFSEIVVLTPGYTIIEIDLIDPFGTQKTYSYSVETSAENPPYRTTQEEANIPIDEESSLI